MNWRGWGFQGDENPREFSSLKAVWPSKPERQVGLRKVSLKLPQASSQWPRCGIAVGADPRSDPTAALDLCGSP
jgi:hypothetical protein